jgi:branched-chain amino acid transport system ATP-binding protein
VLAVENLDVRYGGVEAVSAVSFAVELGQVVTVLGPNGAGKTTTLSAISGLVAHDGRVTVDGDAITDPVSARRHGIAHLVQGRGLFRKLTVAQNLALGAYGARPADVKTAVAEVAQRLPELRLWWGRKVGTLSGGEQVVVALGRLLAARPRYALLDEPGLGLDPRALERLMREVHDLRDAGVGVVLVEQYAERALAIADRVVVLERGRVTYDGDPAGVGDAQSLVQAYLGAPA